jgi:hypothetical protein
MEEIHRRSRHNHQVSRTDTKTETVLVSAFKSYKKNSNQQFIISALECTVSVNTIFWKLGVKLGNKIQFKCDLEQNTFSYLIPASQVNQWKCVCNTIWRIRNVNYLILVQSGDRTL